MEKASKPEKWVPVDNRTKKQQRQHHAKKRGPAVPPTQFFASDKDYDRSHNREIIEGEMTDHDESEDYDE
ncbi:hypothetical protein FACS189431_3790 [Alphaproteobacteria bacterium]|nr:hypothetical protein FACS189431_3790 [Alphaproteobacteria bacterium]